MADPEHLKAISGGASAWFGVEAKEPERPAGPLQRSSPKRAPGWCLPC